VPPVAAPLAEQYWNSVHAAAAASVAAEPEAQLTTPIAQLFSSVAASFGVGDLQFLREAQLDGVRPDFTTLVGGRQGGWVELKEPAKTVDGTRWTGREKKQWSLLAELDALVVSNGRLAQLYAAGEPDGDAVELPYENFAAWDPQPLADLLRRFAETRPRTVSRVFDLARRLAPLARMLRDRLLASLATPETAGVVTHARNVWAANVHEGVDDASFCNDLAQVMAYSLAIAGLQGGADANGDGAITLDEARDRLRAPAPVLAAALGPVLGVAGLAAVIQSELGAIERLVSVLDLDKIAASHDSRGEPWLWFYEDFLATYDPAARAKAGVYYTPTAVVECQVRLVDHVLRERFGRRYGFGDPGVVVLDPACGSGTYPLAVIDQAAANVASRGPAGPAQAAATLASNLLAFELLPGPYAVASLRIGQRLTSLAQSLVPVRPQVFLTDTLDSPELQPADPALFGDAAELAAERIRARDIKRERPVMVILGNPPYDRISREAGGGWVVHGPRQPHSLFDELLVRASAAGVMFSATASVYNLYVYFWRWAMWKAFEAHGDGPAVVSFITASSWLRGPGFVGLRELARQHGDELWVLDLGGDNKGTHPEENVFAIETPVAVVTIIRDGASSETPSIVRYQRLAGSRAQKLAALAQVGPPPVDSSWETLHAASMGEPLAPVTGAAGWQDFAALTDVMPWQQPGVKFNRTWPIAPDEASLQRRWRALVAIDSSTERNDAFGAGSTGRTVHTRAGALPTLASLNAGSPPEPAVRYGYRSFDRQWVFRDPRLANLERPALWRALSQSQLFLTTMTNHPLGAGPAVTASAAIPDMHHFRGSFGGKDVIPLWRDESTGEANFAPGLAEAWAVAQGRSPCEVSPAVMGAYVYALLSTPGYQERFDQELRTPGPRVPLTADPALFDAVAKVGERLLWLHTFAERCRDTAAGRGQHLPRIEGLGWTKAVNEFPHTLGDVSYEPATATLTIGDGEVVGVRPEVWEFSVSGMQVVRKWLGYRTASGTGRAASSRNPLDKVRPDRWADDWDDELLDLLALLTMTVDGRAEQDDLLGRVCDGPLLSASSVVWPSARDVSRQPPAHAPEAALPGM